MGKLEPYNFGDLDVELEGFRDSVTSLINNGKVACTYLTTGTPTWNGQPAEMVLFRPASGGMSLFTWVVGTAVAGSAWLVLVSATT